MLSEKIACLPDNVNIYLTRDYVVKQTITMVQNSGTVFLVSNDDYYPRTPERELLYRTFLHDKVFTDGKRVLVRMYNRIYHK